MELKQFILNYFPKCNIDDLENIELCREWEKINNSNQTDINIILSWPPNLFIILYSMIEYTDKYRLLVSPQKHFSWGTNYLDVVKIVSNEWFTLVDLQLGNKKKNIPTSILESYINSIFNKQTLNTCTYDLFEQSNFTYAVFILTLAIDELFSNVNICNYKYDNKLQYSLVLRQLLAPKSLRGNLADNDCKLGFVTFKTNVPQSGLTINNLTHNLTFIKPSVSPLVIANKRIKRNYDSKSYNILFLPWPIEIEEDAFKEVTTTDKLKMDGYFGFFEYSPKKPSSASLFLSSIIAAIKRSGTIDLIVFPECSLSEDTFQRFKNMLFECFGKDAPSLLSGVYADEGNNVKNVAKLAFIGDSEDFDSVEQNKHHRWFLDNNQLRNYNLSAQLDPGRKWWENIPVGRRHLVTLHTPDGIKLCPLICEDLARQEPVAQAVRAVGPNLVVSLLLDGPQLAQRWPGKYSAVLSDDPGSSVLSVTALGMTLRSTGLGNKPSRGVALWSEPNKGSETLEIDENGVGIVIGLKLVEEKMWTIDGRSKQKSILRKQYHSTIYPENDDTNNAKVPYLKKQLTNLLSRG